MIEAACKDKVQPLAAHARPACDDLLQPGWLCDDHSCHTTCGGCDKAIVFESERIPGALGGFRRVGSEKRDTYTYMTNEQVKTQGCAHGDWAGRQRKWCRRCSDTANAVARSAAADAAPVASAAPPGGLDAGRLARLPRVCPPPKALPANQVLYLAVDHPACCQAVDRKHHIAAFWRACPLPFLLSFMSAAPLPDRLRWRVVAVLPALAHLGALKSGTRSRGGRWP